MVATFAPSEAARATANQDQADREGSPASRRDRRRCQAATRSRSTLTG